ncbi:MFS transporter [Thiomicrorhabdus chilensis]|uniref:MFS transporter n=1 Tax=Thiomicrorhabdus chilensis TaxID=63656 RepID=UPI00040F0F8A|nr:MFS transporter [Thiomicrorhabdus chilensis]
MNRLNFLQYGLLGLPLAMLGIPLYVYLPTYYAEQSALGLTAVGSALLAARFADVITDPLIGWWSDRYQSRFSRTLQILVASVLLVIGVQQLWLPDLTTLSWWSLFFWSFVTYLAWTAVQIPYLAMAAELSTRSHTKTQLASYREGFAIIGVVLVLILPVILGLEHTQSEFYAQLFALFAFALLIAAIVLTRLPKPITHHKPNLVFWKTALRLWSEHPQVFHIMPSYFLNNLANALPATLFILFVSDYLKLEEYTGLFLLIYFSAGLLALPVWIRLSKRFGKRQTWQGSMLLASLSFIGVFFLDAGDLNGFLIVSLLTGLSLGVDIAMPASIQADITQEVKFENNHRPPIAGLLFGIWGMLTKLTLALAVGMAFPILDWSETINAQDNTILWLYAGLPILLKLIAWRLLNRQA